MAPVDPLCAPHRDAGRASSSRCNGADIDWHGGFILVQRNLVRGVLTSPKSHQRRRVDMSAQLAGDAPRAASPPARPLLEEGRRAPEWVFPSLEGTALEERNVRHVFTRILEGRGSGRSAFTICGTRSPRCCCSRGSPSST